MRKIKYITLCLPLVMPFFFSGDLGNYALLAIVALSLFAIFIVLRAEMRIAWNIPTLILGIFLLLLLVTLPFSLLPVRSITPVLWWLAYLTIFVTSQGLVRERRDLETISIVFVSITAIFGIFSMYVFVMNGLSSYTRLDGIVGGHNIYGGFLMIPFLLSVYLALKESPKWQRVLWMISSAFIFSSLILTFSRGTWLSLAVALAVSWFLFRKKIVFDKFKSHAGKLATILALTAVMTGGIWLLAKNNTIANNTYANNGAQAINIAVFSNEDSQTNAFTARLHYFSDAFATFTHSPIVGFGAGNYAYALRMYKTDPNYGSFADPHNWLLRMMVENGIFAALAFLIFIAFYFWQSWKLIARQKGISWLAVMIFTGLFANMLHGLMDFDWSYNLVLLIFFCFAGALYGILQQSNESYGGGAKFLPIWANYVVIALLIIGAAVSIQLFRADSVRADGDYFFYQKRDYDSAINSYFQSALINKYEPNSWFDLWRVYYAVGNYGAAKNVLKKAIELFPENGLYYTAWAETDEVQKDFGDYRETLLKSIKYFPANDLTDYVKLADFDYKQGKYSEALAVIDEVLPIYEHYQSTLWFKSDPNSPAIEKNLVLLNGLKSKIAK